MLELVQKPGEYEVRFDDDGREICTHPLWLRTREAIKGKMFNRAALFGIILRDSRLPNDRRLAAYGTFYCDDPAQIFELIAFFPGEPLREIREEAYRRAIGFLRVHWTKNALPREGVPPDPDYPPHALYQLEVGPYLALLEVEEARDRAQGLWFLGELCRIRADSAKTVFQHARKPVRALLVAEDRLVRQQARDFVLAVDPAHREPPPHDATDAALLAWLDAVIYEVFPPIRSVSKGRVDLFPSADLDRRVEVGRVARSRAAIGEPEQGKLAGGVLYRGFRVARLPAPLDKLRIPLGAVITAVNGMPVATGAELLAAVEKGVPHRQVLLVEYVRGGRAEAMEFRLQPAEE